MTHGAQAEGWKQAWAGAGGECVPCPGLLPWGLAFLRTTRGVSAGVPGSGAAGRKSLRARRPAFPANPTGDGLHPLQWPSGLRSCVTVPPVTHEDCHWEVKGPASVSSNMAEPGLGLDGRAQCLRPFLRPSRLRPTRPLLGPHWASFKSWTARVPSNWNSLPCHLPCLS